MVEVVFCLGDIDDTLGFSAGARNCGATTPQEDKV
jgi:hypothetical protein